ncbi:ATP-binding protein [Streptomyces sp. NPDC001939]
MDGYGKHDMGRSHDQVPSPSIPPASAYAPGSGPLADGLGFLEWLRAPRPEAGPGVWRLGHKPRSKEDPELVPGRQLVVGALLALLVAWFAWSLLYNGYLGWWWFIPLQLVTPDSWRRGQAGPVITVLTYYGYFALVGGGLLFAAGKIGRWGEVWRRYIIPRFKSAKAELPPPSPGENPAEWPQLRAAGAGVAADRLAADARTGLMRDVDHARIMRAWQSVRSGQHPLSTFTDAVLTAGAAACAHPSGVRDLPARSAQHDLLTHQVRLGTAADDPKNPHAYRAAGVAVGPEVLGTSLLAVGPSGSGKTSLVIRPVVEALCLQALAGRAAVVVVGTAGAVLGDAAQYDIVIRIGDPASTYDLDLYGGTTDPDEAAAVLAEALVGDLVSEQAGGDSRRAATVLAQLLGPFRAVHGRFPSVAELRQLLDGAPARIEQLRRSLEEAGQEAMLRELDARERQSGGPGDTGAVLADRIALLDRHAFAGFFDTTGQGQPFSLRALDHPVRVRIDLPDRGHADTSRILIRLLLAQFTASAVHREDRSLFACLVLDDAARAITTEAVRGVQRLRSANAGVVLALRVLDEVAPALRAPLLGAVGCRMALSGVTSWDGQQFAEVWGKEWIEARDVTDRQIIAETAGGRAWHILRQAISGKAPTARAVTVRQVERERWSPSELAHAVPPGHAVMSLTSLSGDRTSPLLVKLRG